jgi:hypothetical protein
MIVLPGVRKEVQAPMPLVILVPAQITVTMRTFTWILFVDRRGKNRRPE